MKNRHTLLKNAPRSPQQLDSGATTDNALSEIDFNPGNGDQSHQYVEAINDNLTHSEKRKLPLSQLLRPQSILNDSNVSSIMQVSFARQPEGKGIKMRCNSEYQGNNSAAKTTDLKESSDVRLKTQPDEDKQFMQPEYYYEDGVNQEDYQMFGGVYTQVGDISMEGEKSLIKMLSCNNTNQLTQQQVFELQQQKRKAKLQRDLFGAKEENQETHPSSFALMPQYKENQFQNQSQVANDRKLYAPSTTPITEFKPTASGQSSPELSKLRMQQQGRSSQYFQNRRVSKNNIPNLNLRENVRSNQFSASDQQQQQQILNAMFQPTKIREPFRNQQNNEVVRGSPQTRSQHQLNMIEEGTTNQENISTARGFGMSSRMKEISVNGIDQFPNATTAASNGPQNYNVPRTHDIMQFKDDESDDLLDPDLVGSITDRQKFILQASNNIKRNMNQKQPKCQLQIEDNVSYTSSANGIQSNIPSLPSSTRNSHQHYPIKSVQKVGGGAVKKLNLPHNRIQALQLSGNGSITPSEFGTGFITPSTSALQCKRGENGLSSQQSSAQLPRYHHQKNSSSVSNQFNPIIKQTGTKFRESSKTQAKRLKGRSLTPNVTSSSKKYASQGGIVITNSSNNNGNNIYGPLNSSRYSEIQRKKREDISIQVANILNSHNSNRMTRQSSVGSHRYSSLDPMQSITAVERSFANNNSLLGAKIQQNYVNNNTMSDLSKQLSIDLQRNNTMVMMENQPISQEVSMLQSHNHLIQHNNVAKSYIESQERMEQQTSQLIKRSEKLKLELLTQFEMNNPTSRRSTSVPPQRSNQRQQNYFSAQHNPSSNQVSPRCADNVVNSSQIIVAPSSATAGGAPSSMNVAIQKTLEAANDKNTQILSRVDQCKKEVVKMRDDLNDIVIKNIQLQQKTSSFSEKAQQQQTRITRLQMKLRARTQQLNELQSNSQVFLSKVKKGQTEFIMRFQNFKKQCELKINTLLQRDQVATKEIANLNYNLTKLQEDGQQKADKIEELRNNLIQKQERLRLIEPQFNEINSERKDLKLQVEKMRNLQKDLASRESQIKLAEKNYYKSISSSTLDELRKFDQRQAMILQQLSSGKENVNHSSSSSYEVKQSQQRGNSNFLLRSKNDENQLSSQKQNNQRNKLLNQRQELMQERREFQKKRNTHNQNVRKFELQKKDYLTEKAILQEKEKRWQAQAMSNKTSRWSSIILGIVLGSILMFLMNQFK